jgi:hypothetical protein
VPVGGGEDEGLQEGVVVSGLDDQIVTLFQHFLNDALEGTVVPEHLHFAFQSSGPIGSEDLVEPLRRWAMTPWRISSRSSAEHGGHFVREVVNGQEQGQLGAFIQLGDLDRALERDLALLLGIDHHQNVSVLDHVLLLLGKNTNDGRLFSYYSLVKGRREGVPDQISG